MFLRPCLPVTSAAMQTLDHFRIRCRQPADRLILTGIPLPRSNAMRSGPSPNSSAL